MRSGLVTSAFSTHICKHLEHIFQLFGYFINCILAVFVCVLVSFFVHDISLSLSLSLSLSFKHNLILYIQKSLQFIPIQYNPIKYNGQSLSIAVSVLLPSEFELLSSARFIIMESQMMTTKKKKTRRILTEFEPMTSVIPGQCLNH